VTTREPSGGDNAPGQGPYPPPPEPPPPGGAGPWASDNLPPHPMSYAAPPDVPQPSSILLAVRLMYVGAALSVIGLLTTVFRTDEIREAVEDSDRTLTESEVDTVVNVGIAFAIVIGLVGVGLWIWMAVTNGRGLSWARVVATVFGGLNVLFTLVGFSRPESTGLANVIGVLGAVLAVVILVLLWQPESSRYYEAKSR
jgi:hypothetical protein